MNESERVQNEINKNNCEFEPLEIKVVSEFRNNDKKKYLTSKGFSLRLRTKFNNIQAWKCVEQYPLREEYKGGFEETGVISRKRNKEKELSSDFILTAPGDIWKNLRNKSITLRAHANNKALMEMKQRFDERDEYEDNIEYKKRAVTQDQSIRVIPKEETLYSWFHNHPITPAKISQNSMRNVMSAVPKYRVKLYKKSLETHYFASGTSFIKEINRRKYTKKVMKNQRKQVRNSALPNSVNRSINENELKGKNERNEKTPTTNFTRPKCGL